MRTGGVGGTRAGAGRLGSVAVASGLALLLLVGLTGCGQDEEAPEAHSEPTEPDAAANEDEASTTTEPDRAETPPTSYAPDTVEGEIEAAYLGAINAFQEAVIAGDPSDLGRFFTGRSLEALSSQVEDLAAAGQSGRFDRTFGITVSVISSEDGVAAITDEYENHSVTLDRETGEPTEADPNESVLSNVTLLREGEAWKVSEIVLESQPLG